ncbi:hypothetical protein [Nocardioides sp. GY 10127]|uniref:hypothetical protein n=1 Tax=Nocardioides sp. GY 10127 TaxID=2569762 RepID=UPI0010A839E8|nr:hypothetical protein [Nocardioides sp. GY 10127]TIC81606.1 hypothetical protein E8D37_10360 [Nocardioides sp. GY 10127]
MAETLSVEGFEIDLEKVYAAMYAQSKEVDGVRVFDGADEATKGLKAILKEECGVPAAPKAKKGVTARKAVRAKLTELGWATPQEGSKAAWTLTKAL